MFTSSRINSPQFCSECCKHFNNSVRVPKILPCCNKVLCLECIKSNFKLSQKCLHCKKNIKSIIPQNLETFEKALNQNCPNCKNRTRRIFMKLIENQWKLYCDECRSEIVGESKKGEFEYFEVFERELNKKFQRIDSNKQFNRYDYNDFFSRLTKNFEEQIEKMKILCLDLFRERVNKYLNSHLKKFKVNLEKINEFNKTIERAKHEFSKYNFKGVDLEFFTNFLNHCDKSLDDCMRASIENNSLGEKFNEIKINLDQNKCANDVLNCLSLTIENEKISLKNEEGGSAENTNSSGNELNQIELSGKNEYFNQKYHDKAFKKSVKLVGNCLKIPPKIKEKPNSFEEYFSIENIVKTENYKNNVVYTQENNPDEVLKLEDKNKGLNLSKDFFEVRNVDMNYKREKFLGKKIDSTVNTQIKVEKVRNPKSKQAI